jgi:hypothetical protein
VAPWRESDGGPAAVVEEVPADEVPAVSKPGRRHLRKGSPVEVVDDMAGQSELWIGWVRERLPGGIYDVWRRLDSWRLLTHSQREKLQPREHFTTAEADLDEYVLDPRDGKLVLRISDRPYLKGQ